MNPNCERPRTHLCSGLCSSIGGHSRCSHIRPDHLSGDRGTESRVYAHSAALLALRLWLFLLPAWLDTERALRRARHSDATGHTRTPTAPQLSTRCTLHIGSRKPQLTVAANANCIRWACHGAGRPTSCRSRKIYACSIVLSLVTASRLRCCHGGAPVSCPLASK